MNYKHAGFAAALLFAGMANSALADERIVNGNFSSGFSGWSTSGAVDTANDALYTSPAAGGTGSSGVSNYVAFGGGNVAGGSLFQTFATVVGQAYTLTFNFAGFGTTSAQLLKATATDAVSGNDIASTQEQVKVKNLSTSLNDIFEEGYLSFIASSNLTKLTFADISVSSINADMLLANVSVNGATPVPGPEAGAGLGALAMGGLAIYLKRRRKNAVAGA